MAKKSNKNMRVIAAVDAGNGGVKSVVWKTDNKTYSKDIFPASRAEISGDRLGVSDEMRFVEYGWNNKLYAIGDEVLNARSNIDRHLGANRYGNELHQMLTACALARQGVGAGVSKDADVVLILFAPPGMHRSASSVIKKTMQGQSVSMSVDGKMHTWAYEAVHVMPEGLAAGGAFTFDDRGSIKDRDALKGISLFADGGTLTLDFILMKDGQFNPETLSSATNDSLGIQEVVIMPVLRKLRSDERFRYVAVDHLDSVLRNGMKDGVFELRYGGHKVDLTYEFEERFRVLSEQAMNVFDSDYRGLRDIERLILVGGWEDMVFAHIKATYPDKLVSFPGDGVFANSIGAMNAFRASINA